MALLHQLRLQGVRRFGLRRQSAAAPALWIACRAARINRELVRECAETGLCGDQMMNMRSSLGLRKNFQSRFDAGK